MTDLPDISPNLGLPFYLTKQNEFEVQHNEALLILDALVMLSVLDRDLASPPAEPVLGERYIVASPGTGAFAGKDNRIAQYDIGGWNFYAPQEGWTCYVRDEHALLAWDGESWEPAIDVLGEVSELQNLNRLGIGTDADATNPFAAKLNNVLWVAKTEAEGGDGNLRYKLSKESADKTLSLLFQTGYDGRAEIGLAGDDDFRFKVSADGETWLDAIVIDHETGEVSMPQTAPAGAPADLDVTLAGLALGLADALNVAQFLGSAGNRFADSFDALTDVDTGGATNLDTGAAGVLKPTVSAGSMISAGAGSIVGNMSDRGGTAAAFDGTTSQNEAAASGKNSTPAGTYAYVGKDFGAGTEKQIGQVKVYSTTDTGYHGSGGAVSVTIRLYGSNSSPSNSTDGTLLGTLTRTSATGVNDTIASADPVTAWRYVWVAITHAGGTNTVSFAEVQLSAPGAPNNLTVASTALTAAAAPTSMKLVAQTKHIDAITLGTDLIFEVSRDNGTTWTGATMNDRFTVGDIHVLESDDIDVSGQPSGTQVKWRARTANNKLAELHGVYLYWS